MKLIKENNKWGICESFFKTVKKSSCSYSTSNWPSQDEIDIFKNPLGTDVRILKQFKSVRIGVYEDGNIYVWNYLLFHTLASDGLVKKTEFSYRWIYTFGNVYVKDEHTTVKEFEKYLKTDDVLKKAIDNLKFMIPDLEKFICSDGDVIISSK